MKKINVNAGAMCWVRTRYCAVDLLCTVVANDNQNIKVKLPCKLQGATHDVVNLKDIRLVPPKSVEPVQHEPTKPNAFRSVVESLQAEEDKPIEQPVKPAKPAEKPRKINHLPLEIQQYLSTLPEDERKGYLDLWA